MKKIDLFQRLRLSFVGTCVCAVSILLVVLFTVLWFINYRNNLAEINVAMERMLVLNEYNFDFPPSMPNDSPESYDEVNSLYSKTVLFTASKSGTIDYQNLYESYPYLEDMENLDGILTRTIETAHEGKKYFEHDYRFYRVAHRSYEEYNAYIYYDFSTERQLFFRSAFWYLIAFIFATIAVGLLAYLLSDHVLDPVQDGIKKGKDLISNASHELKTPLTIIKANLSVIQSEPNATIKDNEKWFQTIEEQIERTNSLVLDMLELSRLDSNEIRYTDGVDLSALVTSATLSVEALCYEKSIKFKGEIEENVFVSGSKEHLERLVLILLDNAIKYTPDQGELMVFLRAQKKNIYLSVWNTGEGIKKEDLAFVFERFYKGDRARTQETNKKSFGLGLAIAKTICDNHKAKIECFSEVDKYTEFRVTFRNKNK